MKRRSIILSAVTAALLMPLRTGGPKYLVGLYDQSGELQPEGNTLEPGEYRAVFWEPNSGAVLFTGVTLPRMTNWRLGVMEP